jgi:hypothetical protein
MRMFKRLVVFECATLERARDGAGAAPRPSDANCMRRAASEDVGCHAPHAVGMPPRLPHVRAPSSLQRRCCRRAPARALIHWPAAGRLGAGEDVDNEGKSDGCANGCASRVSTSSPVGRWRGAPW